MITVDIDELKSNLTKYLERAGNGEEITVISNGRAIATITPPTNKRSIARQQLNKLATNAKIHSVSALLDSHWNGKS